jgi:single-strand DNA-binding protein
MNVVAWDQLAENVAASLTKGTRVLVTGRLDVREYEAREGGKRTSVDIAADEIGPTLRWATVTVERTPPKGGGEGGGSAPRQAPRSGGAPSSAPANDGYYADEEPF